MKDTKIEALGGMNISGLVIKVISAKDRTLGDTFFSDEDREHVNEMNVTRVGIIDKATANGKTGVVICLQEDGSPTIHAGFLTQGLMDGLVVAYNAAKQRFADEEG